MSSGLQFAPGRDAVLYFSRGRGRGHAVVDVAIVEELLRLRPSVDVRMVSYGTGADTIEALGHGVLDLLLPEDNPVLETMVRVGHVIGALRPHLVVAHEEFVALPVATIFQVPAVFVTGWLAGEREFTTQTLLYADEILFIDESGIFDEPAALQGKIRYLGPVLRPFTYRPGDRERARRELGLDSGSLVITVLPGSWTETKAPIFDLVLEAYRSLAAPNKTLLWIAGSDYDELSARAAVSPGVTVLREDWQIDRLMVASDLAITKANRETHKELSSFGVPSVSLSHGLNAPDDTRVAKFETNIALDARSITPVELARHIRTIAENPPPAMALSPGPSLADSRRCAAERIAWHLDHIRDAAPATAGQ